MGIIPVKMPLAVKKILPNYIWEVPTNDNVLYLTFDDGPTPEITHWTLDILNNYQAKATFFCIGDNVEKHPDIFSRIVSEGHAVGNHTQNHIKGWNTKTNKYIQNTVKAEAILEAQIIKNCPQHDSNSNSRKLNLFRPPYGQIKPKQGKALIDAGYNIIMWNVLSFDWDKNVTPEKCLENVVSKSEPGSIIVFHDSLKASKNLKYVLPKVLDIFSKKGFSFKSIEI